MLRIAAGGKCGDAADNQQETADCAGDLGEDFILHDDFFLSKDKAGRYCNGRLEKIQAV